MENEKAIYIAIRKDIKIPRGKEIAQACHAICALKDYNKQYAVIVVSAKDTDHLDRLVANARDNQIAAELIVDAARTVFKKPTITCAAIGPVERGKLKLLNECRLYG